MSSALSGTEDRLAHSHLGHPVPDPKVLTRIETRIQAASVYYACEDGGGSGSRVEGLWGETVSLGLIHS